MDTPSGLRRMPQHRPAPPICIKNFFAGLDRLLSDNFEAKTAVESLISRSAALEVAGHPTVVCNSSHPLHHPLAVTLALGNRVCAHAIDVPVPSAGMFLVHLRHNLSDCSVPPVEVPVTEARWRISKLVDDAHHLAHPRI